MITRRKTSSLHCGYYSAAVDSCSRSVTLRARHIDPIAKPGCTGWKRCSGCSRRSLVETVMYRYKKSTAGVSGALPNSAGNVLNQITNLGMPVSA